MPPPRLVATIGLHGSASTWVFNMVRELLAMELGDTAVLGVYADVLRELPHQAARADRHLVVKSHYGSNELDDWLAAGQAQVFFSVRDPRDAYVSTVRRFGFQHTSVVKWLAETCNRVIKLAKESDLILRYEDRFFTDRAAARTLSRRLGLELGDEAIEAVACRFDTDAVRMFAERLAELPPDRLSGSSHLIDRITQIHAPHIGDCRSGKWRELPAPVQDELTCLFVPFLDRFGYSH